MIKTQSNPVLANYGVICVLRYNRVIRFKKLKSLPSITMENFKNAPHLRLEFLRRTGSGILYSPVKSSDLAQWADLLSTPAVERISEGWERVIHHEEISPGQSKVFGAVRVFLP